MSEILPKPMGMDDAIAIFSHSGGKYEVSPQEEGEGDTMFIRVAGSETVFGILKRPYRNASATLMLDYISTLGENGSINRLELLQLENLRTVAIVNGIERNETYPTPNRISYINRLKDELDELQRLVGSMR